MSKEPITNKYQTIFDFVAAEKRFMISTYAKDNAATFEEAAKASLDEALKIDTKDTEWKEKLVDFTTKRLEAIKRFNKSSAELKKVKQKQISGPLKEISEPLTKNEKKKIKLLEKEIAAFEGCLLKNNVDYFGIFNEDHCTPNLQYKPKDTWKAFNKATENIYDHIVKTTEKELEQKLKNIGTTSNENLPNLQEEALSSIIQTLISKITTDITKQKELYNKYTENQAQKYTIKYRFLQFVCKISISDQARARYQNKMKIEDFKHKAKQIVKNISKDLKTSNFTKVSRQERQKTPE